MSVGKSADYWLNFPHNVVFDIENEVLRFLHDPEGYCNKLDHQVKKEFFSCLNRRLETENLDQPPVTRSKAAAKKILGSLMTDKGEKRYKDVNKSCPNCKETMRIISLIESGLLYMK